jgi:hypothetical protein
MSAHAFNAALGFSSRAQDAIEPTHRHDAHSEPKSIGMSGRFLAAFAIVLALGIAWLMVTTRDRGAQASESPVVIDASARSVDDLGAGVQALTFPGGDRSALATSRGTALEIEVIVVDRASRQPIAGARVRAASTNGLVAYDEHRPQWHPEDDELLSAANANSITDEHGRAIVTLASLPAIVDARSGESWGSSRVRKDSALPILIEIELDRELAIQVVDGAGRPVSGVPVGIRSCPGDGMPDDAWSGVTQGAQGIARVRHVERYLARLKTSRACAHLAILAHDLERAEFDLDALPAQPIVLHLPPTGSVEIALFDDARRPVFARSILLSEGSDVGADGFPVKVEGPQLTPLAIDEGRALYPHVGLDLDLVAFASAPGYPAKGVHAIGPRVAGERVTIDLDLGAGTFIVARLVDVSGVALANRAVRAEMQHRISHGFGGSNTEDTKSDASGRIRLPIYTKATPDLRGTIAIRVDAGGNAEESSAVVSFPANMHAGDNDLGDVRVERPSMVLSGAVVDELGRPVPNALIGVQMHEDARASSAWQGAVGLSAACNADGKFVVNGPMPTRGLRLSARMIGYAQGDFVEAKPGDREVRILLPHVCKLTGSLLVDPSMASLRWLVVLKRGGDPKERSDLGRNESAVVKRDGGFELDGLCAGVVAVEIHIDAHPITIAVIDQVELRPGEESRDARLQNLDLRHVHMLQIDIVDENEQTVRVGHVICAESDTIEKRSYSIANGSVHVIARSTSIDLDIRAPGFRPMQVHDVSEDRRVRLAHGPVVRIRLAENAADVRPEVDLGVNACRVGSAGDRSTDVARLALGRSLEVESWIERGEASLRFSEPGDYELRWMIRRSDDPRKSRELANAHPQHIEVIESNTEQQFTAAPDPAEVDDALRAFARSGARPARALNR